MVSDSLRSSVPALMLVGMLVLSGCLGTVAPGSGDADQTTAEPTDLPEEQSDDDTDDSDDNAPPSDEELTDTLNERMSEIESLTMTQRMTVVFDGDETKAATKVWLRPESGEMRSQTLAPESRAGDVSLLNESRMAMYDADEQKVTVYDREFNGGSAAGLTIVGSLREASVEYEATEQIDGERTYRVTLVPNGTMNAEAEMTAWLDAETYFPKRVETTSSTSALNTTTTIEYENVSLNPTIPDTTFTFDDLPEDVEWEEYSTPDTSTYDSREAMTGESNLSVPAPDVPTGYEFESGRIVEGTTESVSITYTNGDRQLSVTAINTTYETADGSAENVTIDGNEARYTDFDDRGLVTWSCDGKTYSVHGPFDEAGLVDIAESIGCH
ncbi:DUF4367 domain-containing protein [Halostella sp. PRR32]|uniref:DUF4367 domain-containing protein n=1 Tax=Halostella sp. PRR32 TaxID=3098147 RepID=UPI002B1E3786|nr:DUF4367 domain-containing protein [Halostella sp. PRR32]